MSSSAEYIRKLSSLSDNIDQTIKEIVLENEGGLLTTIKLRLYQKSLDGNYNFLGPYSESTAKYKKKRGLISNRVTLRDTGSWYGSMYIDFVNQEIIVESTEDRKTNELMDVYGEAILELTEAEVENFIDTIIDPSLNDLMSDDLDLGTL